MNIKKILILASLLVSLSVQAQYFDWVKSYTGHELMDDYLNCTTSSATDSDGYYYLAGHFARGAKINDQDLLPFEPYGQDIDDGYAFLIKFSPDGEIIWKKILASNQGFSSAIHGIQLVGDSAIYVNAVIGIPIYDNESYLYFYDKMITKSNIDDLLYADSLYMGCLATNISVFDLDGNLKENYLLQMAYKDSTGRLITIDRLSGNDFDSVYIADAQYYPGYMQIDNNGNIFYLNTGFDETYLYDPSMDTLITYNLANGRISELVVLINGHQRFSLAITSRPRNHNLKIIKFAPKFSDILECRYIFGKEVDRWEYAHNFRSIINNNNNHLYALFNIQSREREIDQQLSGDSNLVLHIEVSASQGTIIDFDNSLFPQDIITLQYDDPPAGPADGILIFNHLVPVKDSNFSFIIAHKTHIHSDRGLSYKSQPINIRDKNISVLKINTVDNSLLDYRSIDAYNSLLPMTPTYTEAISYNGRLFFPTTYFRYLNSIDTTYSPSNLYHPSLGISAWDYSLNDLGFIHVIDDVPHGFYSTTLAAHDSSLYISFSVEDNVTFLDSTYTKWCNTQALITRYVDTIFSSFPSPSIPNIAINNVSHQDLVIFPNPTKRFVSLNIPDINQSSFCYITSPNGRKQKLMLSSNIIDLESFPPGIYILEFTLNNKTYHHKIIKL